MNHDFHQAFRSLVRRPGFTFLAVGLVALGIATNTAVWSVVDAVLLDPVPYEAPAELVDVLATNAERGLERIALTSADFIALRDASTSFSEFGAYIPFGSVDLVDPQGELQPLSLPRHLVSADLLSALRVRPILGRVWSAAETANPDSAKLALLSHELWQTRFSGDREIIGRALQLDGESHAVIGVLPADFRLMGGSPRIFLPLVLPPAAATDRDTASLGAIGRLAPGVTVAGAAAELASIGQRLEQAFPDSNRGLRAVVTPLEEVFVRTSRGALWMITGAVALLLLIVCVNVANLQLVRAVDREQELAVRLALGASIPRLARQLLVESALLATAGGVLGGILAHLALEVLPSPRGVYLPTTLDITLGAGALGVTVVLVLVVTSVAGLLPALRLRRIDPERALRVSRGSDAGRGRLQGLFVVAQTAIASTLLIVFGLLAQSFLRLESQDLGFRSEDVVVMSIALPEVRYPEAATAVDFFDRLESKIEAIGGVAAVASASELPPGDGWGFRPRIEGEADDAPLSAAWKVVTPGYFAAVSIPIVRGRGFADSDLTGTSRVMMVNQSFATRLLAPDLDAALGQRVRFNDEWWNVIGVVADVESPGELTAKPGVYLDHRQQPVPASYLRRMSLVVRVDAHDGDGRRSEALIPELRAALSALDPQLPASGLQTFDQRLASLLAFSRPRFNALFLGSFAWLALLLAGVGLYAVLSHVVSRGRRDLAIRLTQGARQEDLFRLVLGRGLRLTLIGVAVGVVSSSLLGKVLDSLLFGVASRDPLTWLGVAGLLLVVATLACLWPAVRASRVQPADVLRLS